MLVHVSNFRPLKRVDDVVRIFAEVHRVRPAVLLLIGDGPERSRVEALARQLGLGNRVVFVGKMLSFVELLQASDVFLMPSESESFGLAALEALSCGVPVVASDVGGIPEVVPEGEVGFLAPVGDVATMAERVLRILADAALHARLSRAARARAVQQYGLQPAIDRYEAHYERVLQPAPPKLSLTSAVAIRAPALAAVAHARGGRRGGPVLAVGGAMRKPTSHLLHLMALFALAGSACGGDLDGAARAAAIAPPACRPARPTGPARAGSTGPRGPGPRRRLRRRCPCPRAPRPGRAPLRPAAPPAVPPSGAAAAVPPAPPVAVPPARRPRAPEPQPQSGLLTAGSWDDNLNYDFFKRYTQRSWPSCRACPRRRSPTA